MTRQGYDLELTPGMITRPAPGGSARPGTRRSGRTSSYVLLSLLARANRETDVVDVLRGDHGPGVHGREPERLPERLHVDGQHRAARGRRGPGPAQICSGLHGIDRVEQLG